MIANGGGGCANCNHESLVVYETKLKNLKVIFSQQAKIAGYEEYAIIKCSCESGFAWRPIEHPDAKKYAIEHCTI